MATLHQRYIAGECSKVWHELRIMGPAIRQTHTCVDASAVAAETMRRARRNVETIIRSLTARGYAFGKYPRGGAMELFRGPLIDPSDDSSESVDRLEREVGPLPLSLRAWWHEFGIVDLRGSMDGWPRFTDALMICSVEDILTDIAEWRLECETGAIENPSQFCVNLSPDIYQKEEASGAGPYCILVPDNSADGKIAISREKLFFVDYLRECFAWSGFPALARIDGPSSEFARELGAKLEPL